METRILRVPCRGERLGHFDESAAGLARLDRWTLNPDPGADGEASRAALEEARAHLRRSDTPVGFPTETVYGLGADATRSASVRGIYAAKGRPSDNPLISHVCDLQMLRDLLRSDGGSSSGSGSEQESGEKEDPIPERYRVLIEKFWPGPLTILLPNPSPPKLAPEVTAGLPTFGVRMPSSPLALSLIKLVGRPLAAPSANASTRPSPTTAAHVRHDLDGRIELILDGGACPVGVESTVVDGLCEPPAVLRPGGVGIEELRACPGWEGVVRAYEDRSEPGAAAPRAPGMKYKHYSPRARVILYEASCHGDGIGPEAADLEAEFSRSAAADGDTVGTNGTNGTGGASPSSSPRSKKVGVIRTQRWKPAAGLRSSRMEIEASDKKARDDGSAAEPETSYDVLKGDLHDGDGKVIGQILDIDLGKDTKGIAQGLFSALRELDALGADVIFVDGVGGELDMAAAVMNRLRKAASEIRA
ncbi:hypothetical protein N3K66_001380 [Trichothecium roseum]|uniref:Uncharacterized protein n=1 Tax=Trichothecium roseum TaxID=47278 RepID=A0ACC0VG33_9HYPO|nr:hypothetical protein N3K66_001380 [Trichothecium roseum]